MTKTTEVEAMVSLRVGQVTLDNSTRTSRRNCFTVSTTLEVLSMTLAFGSAFRFFIGLLSAAATALTVSVIACAGAADFFFFFFFDFAIATKIMAGQEGFEPPTSGFGVRRSSRSSYWPAVVVFSTGDFFPSKIQEYWKVGILGPKKCKTIKNVLFPLFTPSISLIP